MSFLTKLLGGSAAQPIEAIGNVFDKLFTSDEERAQAEAVLTKIAQKPHILQAEISKIEAQHRSTFVAGWRPAIGWVAAVSLAFFYIPQYAVATYLWVDAVLAAGYLVPYPTSADGLLELVFALLGLGALRTVEKLQGKSK